MTSLQLLADLDLADEPAGAGLLTCAQGNLPLVAMTVVADITGLLSATTIRQTFANPHACPIEAQYIFPLPDRAAVTGLAVTIGSRHIAGLLQERQAARQAYDDALAAGQRAALMEQDRPDVFTTSIGNLAPGEEATVEITLAGAVGSELGEASFRVPLVLAPRYIPGRPLDGEPVGLGTELDTDAVPDASRITPPVLLPGSANPVRLAVTVRLDPAGLSVSDLQSSLHAVTVAGELPGPVTIELRPGERLNRDFVLRYRIGGAGGEGAAGVTAMAVTDLGGAEEEGTYIVTVLPPNTSGTSVARDVVLVLDRSGSMDGWKMVAARRAAARIVDSLTSADRFALLAFDHQVERPDQLPGHGLVVASDRNRYRAVEWLGRLEARGGTEMTEALTAAQAVMAGPADPGRSRCWILVTDGQVGNEDQLVRLAAEAGVRMYTVGIDRAVNAGLLRRLAAATGGRCDLVESEDRLDRVLADLQRRIGHPILESVTVHFDGLAAEPDTVTPDRPADLYPGVPLVIRGRFRGRPGGRAVVTGHDGTTMACPVTTVANPAAAAVWARAHLRDLEDRYVVGDARDQERLADRIVQCSLRHRVLCRFTAWVAVDQAGEPVDGPRHSIVQPVEMVSGWAGTAAPTVAGRPAAVPAGGPLGTRAATAHLKASASNSLSGYCVAQPLMAPPPPPVIGLTEDQYLVRLDELLAAIDRLGDPLAPRSAGELTTLASEARLLAGDIGSVGGGSAPAIVGLLESLADALATKRSAAIRSAAEKLREVLRSGRKGRSRRGRAKAFWR
ncbi:MAG: VIT and VWA domain-containing protein [Actinomycetota bacterium]|nr:VIT and VWA domain-containing protein [Actinomycetota bacterium]